MNLSSLSGKTDIEDSDCETVTMTKAQMDGNEGGNTYAVRISESSITESGTTTAETASDGVAKGFNGKPAEGVAWANLSSSPSKHETEEQQEPQKQQDIDKEREEEQKEVTLSPQHAAYKAWQGYLRLNDSIVTDLFAGILQSTLECQNARILLTHLNPF